ncbi:hypothetical protein GCM10011400_50060 [Paraburkholderia caffeinilytica]|uniref:Uncharacterized protein n=1 Tax=Paraburkholderia caffeinilytica TaxID=1761016 RepID=A0ABQ1NA74_9BURK|nr:hypothetical protein GCM10011400_50060 [Paraburkholderia caffeinilytica]
MRVPPLTSATGRDRWNPCCHKRALPDSLRESALQIEKKRPPGGDGAQTVRDIATGALNRGNLSNDADVLAGAAAVQRLIRTAQSSWAAWCLNRHARGRGDG